MAATFLHHCVTIVIYVHPKACQGRQARVSRPLTMHRTRKDFAHVQDVCLH
jgi:hypothetical protein